MNARTAQRPVIDPEPLAADPASDSSNASTLGALLRALASDAQTLLQTETGYWQAFAAFALSRARTIAVLVVAALFFLFFALMALVVGLLLALVPLIGAWAAMGLVTGVLLVIAAACGLVALGRSKRMLAVIKGTAARETWQTLEKGTSHHG